MLKNAENSVNFSLGQYRGLIRAQMTFTTRNVVYLMQYPCGLQYRGHTVRKLQIRLNEHANIKKGFPNLSISKHTIIKIQMGPCVWQLIDLQVPGEEAMLYVKYHDWKLGGFTL